MKLELKKVAIAWVEMWEIDLDDPARDDYNWVDEFEYEVVYHHPDIAIDLVLEILKLNVNIKTKAVLAAGPLEQVLVNFGPQIIERVEELARTNPQFAHSLGGVWQNAMTQDVWERVQKVMNTTGWN